MYGRWHPSAVSGLRSGYKFHRDAHASVEQVASGTRASRDASLTCIYTPTHSTAKNTYIPGRRLLRSIAPPSIVNDNVQSGSPYYHKHVNNPAYTCTRQHRSRFHITVARSHIDSGFGMQPASADEHPKDNNGSEVARYCSCASHILRLTASLSSSCAKGCAPATPYIVECAATRSVRVSRVCRESLRCSWQQTVRTSSLVFPLATPVHLLNHSLFPSPLVDGHHTIRPGIKCML